LEFEDALYHATWRGDRRAPIFEDDHDRKLFLAMVEQGLARFDAGALAYRLMGNQFHKVLKARRPKLSRRIATSTASIPSAS